ncbi:hypothetical protein [Leifsonia xyli]|uniref:hypothetical protein n=1 Tax=Leifsonia xyli TaxID=1575 RepID=UPI003D66526B
MVATLVRLRLLVLRNSFRRSTSQLVAVIIGALYGTIGLLVVLGALVGLSFAPIEVATTAVVLAGSAAVLGWAVFPCCSPGSSRPSILGTSPSIRSRSALSWSGCC